MPPESTVEPTMLIADVKVVVPTANRPALVIFPLTLRVPICRFPEPVAFVNQMFVDETVPAVSQPVPVALVNKRLVMVEVV